MANGPTWKNEADRIILADVYRTFAVEVDENKMPVRYQEWFRGAGIVDNHPTKLGRTLVINVNYFPAVEQQKILELSQKHNIQYHLEIIRDRE